MALFAKPDTLHPTTPRAELPAIARIKAAALAAGVVTGLATVGLAPSSLAQPSQTQPNQAQPSPTDNEATATANLPAEAAHLPWVTCLGPDLTPWSFRLQAIAPDGTLTGLPAADTTADATDALYGLEGETPNPPSLAELLAESMARPQGDHATHNTPASQAKHWPGGQWLRLRFGQPGNGQAARRLPPLSPQALANPALAQQARQHSSPTHSARLGWLVTTQGQALPGFRPAPGIAPGNAATPGSVPDSESLAWVHAQLGSMAVPLDQVLAIAWPSLNPASPAATDGNATANTLPAVTDPADVLGQWMAQGVTEDHLLLANGETMVGFLLSLPAAENDQTLAWIPSGQADPIQLPLDRIAGLVLANPPMPANARFRVHLQDGTQLLTNAIGWAPDTCTLAAPGTTGSGNWSLSQNANRPPDSAANDEPLRVPTEKIVQIDHLGTPWQLAPLLDQPQRVVAGGQWLGVAHPPVTQAQTDPPSLTLHTPLTLAFTLPPRTHAVAFDISLNAQNAPAGFNPIADCLVQLTLDNQPFPAPAPGTPASVPGNSNPGSSAANSTDTGDAASNRTRLWHRRPRLHLTAELPAPPAGQAVVPPKTLLIDLAPGQHGPVMDRLRLDNAWIVLPRKQ